MSKLTEDQKVLMGIKPLPFPWFTKSTRRRLSEQFRSLGKRMLLEREVYVDENGVASDDEGNKWQVDKHAWPEGTYFGSQASSLSRQGVEIAPKISSSDLRRWEARAGRLLAALILKGRKTDFIRSIVSKKIMNGYPFTWKQESAFVKSEGYMKSSFAQMPTKGWALTYDGRPLLTSPLDAKAKAWLENEVDYESKGKDFIIKGKSTKPAAVAKSVGASPKASKTSTVSSQGEQLDVIRAAMKKRSDPFLSTVLKSLETDTEWKKGAPDETLKKIRHELYKRGMKKEANLFR